MKTSANAAVLRRSLIENTWSVWIILAAGTGFTRFLFRSRYLYDVDSVNFALALNEFSPAVHQPHPPGYYLYVVLGRLAAHVTGEANAGFVAISITASCLAVILIYSLTRDWYGTRAAIFSSLIALVSPLLWFHGTVALTYIVEAFFSALVGYCCWRAISGERQFLVIATVALGIGAGFRPSFLAFLGPLWVWSLYRSGWRRTMGNWLVLAASLLIWLIPAIHESGGLVAWIQPLWELWRLVPGRHTVLSNSPAFVIARAVTIDWALVLCFGSALFGLRHVRKNSGNRECRTFVWIWVTPGLLFFTFMFFRYVNSGYVLVITPPLFAIFGQLACRWWDESTKTVDLKAAVVGTLAAANVTVFCFAPIYCSSAGVRAFAVQLEAAVAAVRRSTSPADTVLVGFDSHFLGYRHAAYYLPEYVTVLAPPVPSPAGKRIFAVHGRQTRLETALPIGQRKHFVVFPLPDGAEYRAYIEMLKRQFAPGALTNLSASRPELLAGSTSDLPALFPLTSDVNTRRPRVYTRVDTNAYK